MKFCVIYFRWHSGNNEFTFLLVDGNFKCLSKDNCTNWTKRTFLVWHNTTCLWLFVLTLHSDLDCRIVSKNDFQTSFLGLEYLIP